MSTRDQREILAYEHKAGMEPARKKRIIPHREKANTFNLFLCVSFPSASASPFSSISRFESARES
jgi:hypothetical protein